MLLISRLINRSGLRISHSKVFSSGHLGSKALSMRVLVNKLSYRMLVLGRLLLLSGLAEFY